MKKILHVIVISFLLSSCSRNNILKLRTSKITVHLENSIENATKVSH